MVRSLAPVQVRVAPALPCQLRPLAASCRCGCTGIIHQRSMVHLLSLQPGGGVRPSSGSLYCSMRVRATANIDFCTPHHSHLKYNVHVNWHPVADLHCHIVILSVDVWLQQIQTDAPDILIGGGFLITTDHRLYCTCVTPVLSNTHLASSPNQDVPELFIHTSYHMYLVVGSTGRQHSTAPLPLGRNHLRVTTVVATSYSGKPASNHSD